MNCLANKITLTVCMILVSTVVIAADIPVPASEPAKAEKASAQITTTTPTSPAVVKPSKIGSIDLSYIGMESDFGKSVKAELTEKKGKAETKILAEKKKLDMLKESIESKFPTYTPKQREAKSKEFQKKVETFQKLVRESEDTFMKEQESETSKIFTLIEKTVASYGKANDFAIIVVKKDILFVGDGADAQDLTSIILKTVNDTWKAKIINSSK